MEPEGCSRENRRPPRIQPRPGERLRNGHLAGRPGLRGGVHAVAWHNRRRMTTPRITAARFAAVLLASSLVASCGSAGPTLAPATASSGSPSIAPSASPGPGASPRPSAAAFTCDPAASPAPAATSAAGDPSAATFTEIEAQVQELRGIHATRPVARGLLDQAGLRAYLCTTLAEQSPPALVAATEALYKHLLLMPQDASLQELYLDLLSSQVIGLYDTKAKSMFVVTNDGRVGPADEITYAHEFTHALQDQAFNLETLKGKALDEGDRSLAITSLVEGDAYLLMTLWAKQHLKADELAQVAGSTDPAASAALDSLPAILKEPLLAVYSTGLSVALDAWSQGGFSGVDALYANPPVSMEQILHKDKLASREPPVRVTFPDDLAGRLGPGWTVSVQDTLGELQLGIILKEGGAAAPDDAAAGWGGDRIALLEGPDGKEAVVLDTAWDTAADADEYARALQATADKLNAAGRSASVLRPSQQRVVLVSGDSADTMGRVANVLGLAQ